MPGTNRGHYKSLSRSSCDKVLFAKVRPEDEASLHSLHRRIQERMLAGEGPPECQPYREHSIQLSLDRGSGEHLLTRRRA